MDQDIIQEEIFSGGQSFADFSVLGAIIDEVQHLDPGDKLKRSSFLEDHKNTQQRHILKKQLKVLLDVFERVDSIEGTTKAIEAECDKLSTILERNTWTILKKCRELERSYSSLSLYFENTGSSQVDNLVLMNAAIEQLTDIDNTRFIDFAAKLLSDCFDRLELGSSFSMIVIPGYMYSSYSGYNRLDVPIAIWGKIAHQNKALLITDFRDMDLAADVTDLIKDSGHFGKENFRSNIIMTCNYLLGRRCYEDWGEDEDLYVPGSAALAGRIYNMPVARPVSVKTMGNMKATQAVHFDIRLNELLSLEGFGLVTMINKSGKVRPYSNRTLYSGHSAGLKKYSTVRLLHHISKVLIDIINRTAFEAWTSATQQGLMLRIMKFLNGIQGHEMLIRNFRLIRYERELDKLNVPILYLEISFELTGSKDFRLNLQSSMGSGSYEWSSEYSEL